MELLKVDIINAGYDSNQDTIYDIHFNITKGQLIGLIGPNGAGKSTTIKAILGLLTNIDGKIDFTGPNKRYAYIPEQPILFEGLTLWEHLEIAAAASELKMQDFIKKAEELLKLFRLIEFKHHMPTTFSKGMQQKVMIIIGFLMEPEILIIDEPFVGLDPRATKELLSLLVNAKKRGIGILMSTHVLDMAERICDKFILIKNGEMVAKGTLEEIQTLSEAEGASLFDCFDRLMEGEI